MEHSSIHRRDCIIKTYEQPRKNFPIFSMCYSTKEDIEEDTGFKIKVG